MYERIQKICKHLRKESEEKKTNFNEEINVKFNKFKSWLTENGAIFENFIEFPVIYGPFCRIGCKSKAEIKENESFLMIPQKLMIMSNNLNYFDKYINKVKEDIPEKDLPLLYLTLYLYLERKNEKSFFKPYIDIIFLKEEIFYNELNNEILEELNDEMTKESIENSLNKINEIYELITQCEKFSDLKKEEFIECYFKIKSKKIELNDNLVLIPLVDLFYSDNSINLKYEIYDSENMVFKYTSLINNNSKMKYNLYMTKSDYLPFNKASYNKLIPFKVDYNDDDEEEENRSEIKININDY